MKDYTCGELTIKIEENHNEVTMEWIGKSRDREPSKTLVPFFSEVVNDVAGKRLNIDFRNLDIMNSSTVPPIVRFVKNLEDNGIVTKIFYDSNIEWQEASFRALETVAMRFKNISISGD